METFEKHHIEHVLHSFEQKLQVFGFRRKRKDQFIRNASDGIVHAVTVSCSKNRGTMEICPSLSVMHAGAGTLVSEALSPGRSGSPARHKEWDASLKNKPLRFVLSEMNQTGAGAEYVVEQPSEIENVVQEIFQDFSDAHDFFFDGTYDLPSLIQQFETNSHAGDIAHGIQLMALYIFCDRKDDFIKLAEKLSPKTADPITISAKTVLFRKIGAPVSDNELAQLKDERSTLQEINWPSKREEKHRFKEFSNSYKSTLRGLLKGTGWKQSQGVLFRNYEDWFVSNLTYPLPNGGVRCTWSFKPMAIDPLFWEIVAGEDGHKQPLSIRFFGAFTIRPPSEDLIINTEMDDPKELAKSVLNWCDQKLAKDKSKMSYEAMLASLGPLDEIDENQRITAVCLLILLDKLDDAYQLAQDKRGFFQKETGGFIFDGGRSFFDLARDWIVKKRRFGLKII